MKRIESNAYINSIFIFSLAKEQINPREVLKSCLASYYSDLCDDFSITRPLNE